MTTIEVIEAAGAISAIVYLVLATYRRRVCWLFYLLSSILYIPVYLYADLYAETALQLYFIVMGVVGWLSWRTVKGELPPIASMKVRSRVGVVTLLIVSTAILGFLLSKTDSGWYGYPDAFITVGSVIGTLMTARRVLESWVLWIVVNILATGIYVLKGLDYTVVLYAVFSVLSVRGLFEWGRAYKRGPDAPQTL